MTPAERWNQKYRLKQETGEASALLLQSIAGVRPGFALDVACGLGRNTIALAKAGWRVTAVDVSKVALERLGEAAIAGRLPVTVVLADLEKGEYRPAPGSFDLVCVFFYLQRGLLIDLAAAVRPGGLLVAEIHLADNDPGIPPMNPAYLLESGELRKFCEGWEVLVSEEGRTPQAPHKRATARLVARKPGLS
jgi:SAM-dependent methyltransferase